tara:strand:- start:688 stop:1605 length:918 start_codon:yes stop_codon:yes gene_type:complete
MFKYFIIFILSLALNSKIAFGIENKILLKINSEIITTVDIANEIRYLKALNQEIKTLDQNTIITIAKNNLIKDKIKEVELLKNIKELKVDNNYLEFLKKNIYLNIGLNSLEEFRIYLGSYDLKINMIEEKLKIDTNWKKLVYTKYKNQIKIDKEKILSEVKNRKSKFYKLSEILFSLKGNDNMEEKIDIVKKSIVKNGFENTALIYSISDSSIKGGDLGWINSTAISSKILEELSSIKINEFTKPIIVPGGFLILKINDYKEEKKQYDVDEEVEKVINTKINDQLNTFSNLYLNKLKKDIIVNEL